MFSGDFLSFRRDLDNFSSAQVVLGFFGGCSLFSGGFINYVFSGQLRPFYAFFCAALFFGG